MYFRICSLFFRFTCSLSYTLTLFSWKNELYSLSFSFPPSSLLS